MVEFVAARVTGEERIVVNIEDALIKGVWDCDLKIGVDGANQQAFIIMFERELLPLNNMTSDFGAKAVVMLEGE